MFTKQPGVDDPEIDALVKTKVDAFLRALDTIPGGNNVVKKGQVRSNCMDASEVC